MVDDFDHGKDISALHEDTIAVLGEARELLREAGELFEGEAATLVDRAESDLRAVQETVQRLELRLPIVAPMSAGKSTIVNTIAGRELMPHRATAMTTLPVEVVLTPNVNEPQMVIPEGLRQVFDDLIRKVSEYLDGAGRRDELPADVAYLKEGLGSLVHHRESVMGGRVIGEDAIEVLLLCLNDLVRLCLLRDLLTDDLVGSLQELVRIESPFQGFVAGTEEAMGELVIIDTPGPNEASMKVRLGPIIDQQLRNASVVLVVLDFTQFRQEAQAEMKARLEPFLEHIGREKLYVVVNKVDARGENDPDPDEVRRIVSQDLQLTDEHHADRTFEIMALKAFVASRLIDVIDAGTDDVLSAPEAERFGQVVTQEAWDLVKSTASVEVIRALAEKVWDNSGFQPFLERAVHELRRRAAPLVLHSALGVLTGTLAQVEEQLRLRGAALTAGAAKVKAEIEALQRDLEEVDRFEEDWVKKRRTHLDALGKSLKKDLRNRMKALDKAIEDETGGSRGESSRDGPGRVGELTQRLLGSLLGNLPHFTGSPRKQSFQTEAEARHFVARRNAEIRSHTDELSARLRRTASDTVAREYTILARELDGRARPLLAAASKRLGEAFDLELGSQPPEFEFEAPDGSFGDIGVTSHTSADRRVPKRVMRRRWFYGFLFKGPKTEYETVPGETTYQVDLRAMRDQYSAYAKQWGEEIDANLQDYVKRDLDDTLALYFNDLQTIFEAYLMSLRAGLEDHAKTETERDTLSFALGDLAARLGTTRKTAARLTGYVEDVLDEPGDVA